MEQIIFKREGIYLTKYGIKVKIIYLGFKYHNTSDYMLGIMDTNDSYQTVTIFNKDGKNPHVKAFDLVEEYSPYKDFVIDEPVVAWNSLDCTVKGHFAGISPDGLPKIWTNGTTSYTCASGVALTFRNCKRKSEFEFENNGK